MTLTTPQPNGYKLLPPSFAERERHAANGLDDTLCDLFDPDRSDEVLALERVFRAFAEWRQVRGERTISELRVMLTKEGIFI